MLSIDAPTDGSLEHVRAAWIPGERRDGEDEGCVDRRNAIGEHRLVDVAHLLVRVVTHATRPGNGVAVGKKEAEDVARQNSDLLL